jgi:hypothetical protein
MPWCDDCSRFWNPSTLTDGGACPTCGRVVAGPVGDGGDDDEELKAPWHFKLLVALTVLYLAWRAVQLVVIVL